MIIQQYIKNIYTLIPNQPFPKKSVLVQITHNKNVVENAHCDVCLYSLKVDSKNNFDIINVLDNLINFTEFETDERLKAPEMTNCIKISKAGDVWTAGVCIYCINN